MEKHDAFFLLKERIRLQELECAMQRTLLKEQFKLTKESLKPINLIKGSFTDEAKNSLVDSAIGMGSGYLVKKAIVRSSGNPLLKLLGAVIGIGVASVMKNHPDGIKSIGGTILGKLFKKKENDVEKA